MFFADKRVAMHATLTNPRGDGMTKWPQPRFWKGSKRLDWTFENDYEISAVRLPGSRGFLQKKWELTILQGGNPVDPPEDSTKTTLDDYERIDTGTFVGLLDPDVDRICKMISLLPRNSC